jgi:tellurite resistance protein
MALEMDSLDSRRRNLEDAFFLERDRKLIEKLKDMKKLEETKHNPAKASGITNDTILSKLLELNIRAETAASLAIVPLVAVAWADGEVDEDEKKAVLKAIETSHARKRGVDTTLIERWLDHRPPPELLSAWTDYIHGLCKILTENERKTLKKDLMEHAVAVAEASGGFLGMSKISAEERAMLRQLEMAFGTEGGRQ